MSAGDDTQEGQRGKRISRRTALRATTAGFLASTLAGCSQTQRLEYTADPAALAARAGPLGLVENQDEWVEYERRQEVAGNTLEVALTNYSVTYDGEPVGIGVATTPQAEEAGQVLNPLAEASFKELLTDDIGAPLRRQADLGVDADVEWVRGPNRGGFDESATVLDTDVDVQTFTGVTDDDEGIVIHATRTVHRNDVVFVASGRRRPVEPGVDQPVIGTESSVFSPDEINAGLSLYLDALPLVIREEASQLSPEGEETTTTTADGEEATVRIVSPTSSDSFARGDKVTIELEFVNTDRGTITFGDREAHNVEINVTVRDTDGDGTGTVYLNTSQVGHGYLRTDDGDLEPNTNGQSDWESRNHGFYTQEDDGVALVGDESKSAIGHAEMDITGESQGGVLLHCYGYPLSSVAGEQPFTEAGRLDDRTVVVIQDSDCRSGS